MKVVIDDLDENLESRIALLKKAATDNDFLDDLKEVNKDFEAIETKID